jgi:CubicO group peptidase (beta-lactamase class C family)
MQLWESGAFELDDDINDYMPIQIVNPNHPASPITFRMLLSHTSSLNDNWTVMYSTYVQGDTPIPLDQYVEDYFLPGGFYYNAGANFNTWAPGTRWDYCNHGFVLIGYLVQVISGVPFDQYCRDSIFAPLGMDETSWFLAGLDTGNVAMPYHYSGGTYTPLGQFGYADYPAGTLRSSTLQLARHLICYLQYGVVDGTTILDSSTVDLIRTIQYPDLYPSQGLTWFHTNMGGRWIWEHGGGDQGVSTRIAFCPDENSGVVVLTNGESHSGTGQIMNLLFEYASQGIILFDTELTDDIGGDGDSIPEAGETLHLTFSILNNNDYPINDLTANLSLDDGLIIILDGTVSFASIAPDDSITNSNDPFEIEVPADYVSRIDTFFIELAWDAGSQIDSLVFEMAIGQPHILLVDDDDNDSIDRYYRTSLGNFRLPGDIWNSPISPDLSLLNNYDLVIWFTGDYRMNPLSGDEIAVMKGYLDGGGNLFLTGQGIASQLDGTDPAFLNNYLKSGYQSTSYIPVLISTTEGQVFDPSDSIVIQGIGGANNQTEPDQIIAVNDGLPEMVFLGSSELGAVSYSNEYKTLFFSFGFEAITIGRFNWTDRDTILDKTLDFFNYSGPDSRPHVAGMTVSPGDPIHLTDHTPEILWVYHDAGSNSQQMYHIQVSSDNDWSTAETWDTGPTLGSGISAIYAGASLEDGDSYFIRMRVNNGAYWSDWYYSQLRMNSVPIPFGLNPDNMQMITDSTPLLSHNKAIDNESDPLTYTYEVFDDSLMSILVAWVENHPESPGEITSWELTPELTEYSDYYWRVRANDGYENGAWSVLASFLFTAGYICGDSNGDEQIDAGDAVFLINYVFKNGPAPDPLDAGDANCDGQVNVGDAVYLIAHVFKGGPEPCCP